MIKVLVAEDELPLLRGITNMIESIDQEFHIVKRAINGAEALDYVSRNPVDLLFTDINMPMMDGLELLRQLSEQFPEIATVVISGFDEFSYVQKAIQYRSKNYLLKPVNREELETLLHKMKKEMQSNSYKEKEEYLTNLLFKNVMPETEVLGGKLLPICLCAGACSASGGADSPTVNEFWGKIPIRTLIYEICGRSTGVFCYLGRNANELILLIEDTGVQSADQIGEALLQSIQADLPITIVWEGRDFPVKELRRTVFSLFEKVRTHGVYGETTIVSGEEAKREEFDCSLAEVNAILFAVKKADTEKLRKTMIMIARRMKEHRISQQNLEHVIQKLVRNMCAEKEEISAPEQLTGEAMELISDSLSLEQFFEDFLLLWEKFISDETPENGKELMQEVDHFIRTHIEQAITTKMLSRRFGLVSPYLSRLFKEYKGETPTQYIQNIRVECARELLVRYPEMLAKDVAELVGYSNPLYFSKIFKKKTGVYPSEYRMRFGEKKEEAVGLQALKK